MPVTLVWNWYALTVVHFKRSRVAAGHLRGTDRIDKGKFGWYHWMCEKFNIFGMEKHTTHNQRGYICIGHISLETIFIYRGLIDDDLAPVSSDGLSLIQCQTTIQAIDGRMFWHLHASPKLPVLRIYLIPLDGYEMIIRSNIGTGKGLVPSGKKPLPESKLTKVRDALWHH